MTDQSAPPTRRAIREGRRGSGVLIFLRDVVIIVLVAILVSFLVKTFLVRSFYIPSGSMENTLQEQDRILVDQLTPRFSGYQHGDIVVFRDPGGWLDPVPQPVRPPIVEGIDWALSLVGLSAPDSEDHLIKRIIGLPGDHVVCCDALGRIEVNGAPIDESSYLKLPAGETAVSSVEFEVTVPDGRIWVLGDNRYGSWDSRFHVDGPGKGFVPLDNVVGRAFLRTWPFDRFGGLGSLENAFDGVPDPTASPAP